MGLLGVTALFLVSVAGPAQAGVQTRADANPEPSRTTQNKEAIVRFEGRDLNLAKDWGEARACLVWRQGGVLECFRSTAALDAREAQLAPRRAASSSTSSLAGFSLSCASSLRLYENNWYGGRRLSFWDRGFWQNLSDYGFEDRTSSYIVGACYAYMAEHADGGGWWYPGPTYPFAGEPVMSSTWQDTISSIYVG